MLWVLLAATASAQQPTAPSSGASPTFTFDQLLIPTFQAIDPADQLEADRLRGKVMEVVGSAHTLVPFESVPGNWTAEYGPDLYMRACPPDQYGGCTLALAQRALADWGVGATLDRASEGGADAPFVLTVYLVDVGNARDVAVFPVPLTEDEDAVVASIGEVVDLLVTGAFDTPDERDTEQQERDAIEAARRQVMAAYLGQLEEELGEPEEPTLEATAPPAVTLDEVAQTAQEEEVPAWERVGLTQRQYVRYLNSGTSLEEWKQQTRGRAGALIVRVAGGAGQGPWDQRYDGVILRSSEDLQPIHVVQILEAVRGGTEGGELELGVGVLPSLDASFVVGLHTGTATVDRREEVEGAVPLEGNREAPPIQTTHVGLRLTFAPWPRLMVRPTLSAGVAWWQGASIDAGTPYPPLQGPQRWLVQALPGVEVDTPGRVLGLFARGGLEIPVAGAASTSSSTGAGLTDPPQPTGDGGPGWVLQAGLQLRVAPWRR